MSDITGLTAPQEVYTLPGEILNVVVDLSKLLNKRAKELFTGTPIVTCDDDDLLITSKAVSTEAIGYDGDAIVDAGMAITFTVTGQQADTDYSIVVQCDTTKGQRRKRIVRLLCRAE